MGVYFLLEFLYPRSHDYHHKCLLVAWLLKYEYQGSVNGGHSELNKSLIKGPHSSHKWEHYEIGWLLNLVSEMFKREFKAGGEMSAGERKDVREEIFFRMVGNKGGQGCCHWGGWSSGELAQMSVGVKWDETKGKYGWWMEDIESQHGKIIS